MQYNQPLDQPTNPNAPYVDGSPAAGIQGSIVPAASIEYDQREIIAVINAAVGLTDFSGTVCVAPTNAILTQLLSAIEALIDFALPKLLTAPKTLYVNVATGNDTIYDGTSAGISGSHGPFKTIQHACNVGTAVNLNGFNVTINVAGGTYPETINLPGIIGSGQVIIVGNPANPSGVAIQSPNNSAIYSNNVGTYQFMGVTFGVTSAAPGDPGAGIVAGGARTLIILTNVGFVHCAYRHMFAAGGGTILIEPGLLLVNGGTSGQGGHMEASGAGSFIGVFGPTLEILGPSTFSAWAVADSLGLIGPGTPPAPPYPSISGAASVTSTLKFSASLNGVVSTNNKGINYFPGDTPGGVSTGGQYL